MVRVAVGEGPPSSRVALKSLIALAEDQPALQLGPEPPEDGESVLLSDSHFAVHGYYPWLGHLGDADRPLGDRRSLLTTDSEQIDAQWERLDGRTPPQLLSTKRRRRRRRSRQSD